MMDGDEVDAGNERVFEDENDEDALNWEVIYRAALFIELLQELESLQGILVKQLTRKETPNPNVVGTSTKTKKKSVGFSSRKGKQQVI